MGGGALRGQDVRQNISMNVEGERREEGVKRRKEGQRARGPRALFLKASLSFRLLSFGGESIFKREEMATKYKRRERQRVSIRPVLGMVVWL